MQQTNDENNGAQVATQERPKQSQQNDTKGPYPEAWEPTDPTGWASSRCGI
jgi:hypothetical protein